MKGGRRFRRVVAQLAVAGATASLVAGSGCAAPRAAIAVGAVSMLAGGAIVLGTEIPDCDDSWDEATSECISALFGGALIATFVKGVGYRLLGVGGGLTR